MTVTSLTTVIKRLPAVSLLATALMMAQSSFAVVPISSSVAASTSSSSAAKIPVTASVATAKVAVAKVTTSKVTAAKVAAVVTTKTASVKTVAIAATPHRVSTKVVSRLPAQQASLKNTSSVSHAPTTPLSPVSSGTVVQSKPAG